MGLNSNNINNYGNEGFEGVAPELAERARACKDVSELEALAADAGCDMRDDEVVGVDGGRDPGWPTMPEICTRYRKATL